ncbi:2-oxoacid:acceptor oxidoreductase subunit alpha [Natrarchaeobaculum sulfurireducens]|uniref:2-oxoglutarate synthase subunit KorA n=1 Tax=Natrarchaeobaculum sulfurireducens TaxID=2044521 RepID=A0A346PPY7_9EURY|nr:2-oxoacid:acceptor oxidoreductase subunit alpha [Natrarchaeobaculum sulfurireducens]AXR78389.1 Pyruvate:ferredoxin oxidoreductase or related 2-oxoacid:ferredoxin oxidoreductase, alpha subunit and gamma [Natrarchaeobaculum sulfurireducens]AXR81582.1 2-oxoglutarate oxidoreductase, alpha subunit [Natrarchaeobaculum sulfurireducens]
MSDDELIWRIAGGSGDGIDSTSQNFAKALMRSGLDVFTHRHYPSRIRGGHTYVEIRAADRDVQSRGDGYNFLLSLGDSFARNPQEEAYYGNEEIKPLSENLDELREGGIIVYDAGLVSDEDVEAINLEERAEENNWHVYPMDLRGLAKEHGREVMRNTAGVGVTAALLDMELEHIEDLMEDAMSGDVLEANIDILHEAYETTRDEYEFDHELRAPTGEHETEQALLSGSNAIAYGAIDAGCRFIAGYPMTPWTDVFTILSQNFPDMGGISEQVEDEVAAAALAVGASHAGVKAMSGSSGGGFALMSEPLGLAEMTETPIVLVESMRAGPSTGMPTKPEQSDLEFVLYTSQGDSQRVVFAPGNIQEAYEQTRLAFEIAWDYQIPTILIYDQKLSGENMNVDVDFFDREPAPDLGSTLTEDELKEAAHDASGKFKRFDYENAEDGVAPRSLPGQKGGRYLATGNEHSPVGHIEEDPDNRVFQMERRLEKLEAIRTELDEERESNQTYFGDEDADYGIITWGSSQGAVEEAIERLNDDGHSVRGVSVSDMMPFPEEELTEFLAGVEEAMVVEMNATGQFRGVLQKELGQYGEKLTSLLKFNGNPFEPAEIVEGYEVNVADEDREPTAQVRIEPAAGD